MGADASMYHVAGIISAVSGKSYVRKYPLKNNLDKILEEALSLFKLKYKVEMPNVVIDIKVSDIPSDYKVSGNDTVKAVYEDFTISITGTIVNEPLTATTMEILVNTILETFTTYAAMILSGSLTLASSSEDKDSKVFTVGVLSTPAKLRYMRS